MPDLVTCVPFLFSRKAFVAKAFAVRCLQLPEIQLREDLVWRIIDLLLKRDRRQGKIRCLNLQDIYALELKKRAYYILADNGSSCIAVAFGL